MIDSIEEFKRLCMSSAPGDQRRLRNEEASIAVWREAIAGTPALRHVVAHNRTVPTKILDVLAEDPDDHVRWLVAGRRTASPDALARLATDTKDDIRMRVVRNARTPPSVLKVLATDPWEAIRSVADERLS